MCEGYVLSWALIVLLVFHCLLLLPLCVGYVLSWALIVLLLFPCLLLLPCVCRLCFVLGVDCVVGVSLFIHAIIVCVGCAFLWAWIVLLLLHCLLLLLLCV